MKHKLIILSLILSLTSWSKDKVRFVDEVFSQFIVTSDVIYGHSKTQGGKQETLRMDIYQPKNDDMKKRPLIVYAHGGYFLFGDKNEFKDNAEKLAKSGYVVALINYRLIDIPQADTVSKKAVIDAVHDMKAAVRYFNKDANSTNNYKIDPNRIVIGGFSAGAVTSLHYAYANDKKDVLKMGGKWLLKYVIRNQGIEGHSGNPGYSSAVKGVINIAGSIHNSNLVDSDEPFLISIHGTDDKTVPFLKGTTGETTVVTEGSGLIHARANKIGLKNLLIKLEGEDHLAHYTCKDCLDRVKIFLAGII